MSTITAFAVACILMYSLQTAASYDYGQALTKSLLYFEAQRSGILPGSSRVQWRDSSALADGKSAGIDLVGGYYDAGDNVKFGFPMAYTVTLLAWSVVEFGQKLQQKNELENALAAIKWGTDYFIKAHFKPYGLYGEVGDGDSDHACWQRPEDMTTPRDAYKLDENSPGSDLAAETAAAMAAASIAFSQSDPRYANELLNRAKSLFAFADKYRGVYQSSIPVAGQFYSSSGYEDELLWASAWIYKATKDKYYVDYISQASPGGVRWAFSWDDKYVGAQLLITKLVQEGGLPSQNNDLSQYKQLAEQFICNCIQKGYNNVKLTKGGLLWYQDFNNLQYTTSATFIIATYAESLAKSGTTFQCGQGGAVTAQDLSNFVKSQVDYILGQNPNQMSYLVGFGPRYPQKVHHRGASIISIKQNRTLVACKEGFSEWKDRDGPNPNVVHGAVVGGPNLDDVFTDSRDDYQQNEAATGNTAPLVGVLAYLA